MFKHLTLAAAAAALMAPGAASAAEKSNTLTVRLQVNPIILLFAPAATATLEMTATDISADNLDASGKTRAAGRAQFWVASNTKYDITLEPTTETIAGQERARFDSAAGDWISGELFLDTDMTDDQENQADNTDLIGWDNTDGNVTYTRLTRGVRRYGVGAIFNPQVWSGNGDYDLVDGDVTPPAGSASIAPVGLYSTTVTVTVANNGTI